jgi:hypothetical protein
MSRYRFTVGPIIAQRGPFKRRTVDNWYPPRRRGVAAHTQVDVNEGEGVR